MRKPIIGITSNHVVDDKTFLGLGIGALEQDWSVIANDYVEAVIRAGGIPIIIPITTNDEYCKNITSVIDGLLVSGGGDIDPMVYGKRNMPEVGFISPERDFQELYLLDYFYKNTKKPILGICRGLQLINVYFKGTLILDIPKASYPSHSISRNKRYNPSHSVNIVDNSVLKEIVKEDKLYVNSFHHQGIDELASDLIAVASSDDGMIEAVEHKNIKERFLLATQWHPEMMASKHEKQQSIIDYFVKQTIL